jgi:hypothetical protein
VLWEVRNALWVFPLFLMGKIVLTYDQLELRPALANELSSWVHCTFVGWSHAAVVCGALVCAIDYKYEFVSSYRRLNMAETCSLLWNLVNRCSIRRLITGICMNTDYHNRVFRCTDVIAGAGFSDKSSCRRLRPPPQIYLMSCTG